MKRLIIALLIPLTALSQQPANGDNVIAVKDITFSKAAAILLDAGYSFKSKDSADCIVLTEFRPYSSGGGLNYDVRLRVKDSVAYISGHWKMNVQIRSGMFASDPNELREACWKGWRTGGYRMVFSKLQEIAAKLGGSISYAKQ